MKHMLVGHQRNIRYFERVLVSGAIAHAYLFHGPEGVGKRTIALAVAGALFCPGNESKGLYGCGRCENCSLAASGSHPDFIILSPERLLVEEDLKRGPPAGRAGSPVRRAGIGIKNIHELERLLALAPWRGGRRIVLIDDAHVLSREAQSALLKTLEEPSAATVFFLITDQSDAFLPAIRSRCVPMGFTTVSDQDMAPLTAVLPAARRKLILEFAAGRPGVAVRLGADAEFFEEFQADQSDFTKVYRAHLGDQLALSEQASREPAAAAAFIRRLLLAERAQLIGSLPAAAAAGERADFIGSLLDRLMLLESTNVNRRLLMDAIFVELAIRPVLPEAAPAP
ncbi:MAG: AAA family ATPase [Candidatus Sungbacteria bacterium]|uniref:AAA family ATPase n=1 Tax=Candidatus Sungiibacteriota bacterium TaxID=2750080 RepID=A0A933DRI4_9BACT|nr:AAA family ATPase [Candidatus Sungbacteria bacterium]